MASFDQEANSSQQTTEILKNQATILQKLDGVTRRLDKMCDRISKVEDKVDQINGAPPPYPSVMADSQRDGLVLSELQKVNASVLISGSLCKTRQNILIYGLPEKGESDATEATKTFFMNFFGMTDTEVNSLGAFACRLPSALASNSQGPGAVVVSFPNTQNRSVILDKASKKATVKAMRENNITVRCMNLYGV